MAFVNPVWMDKGKLKVYLMPVPCAVKDTLNLRQFLTRHLRDKSEHGELNDIINHLSNGCQFEEVKCSNECEDDRATISDQSC